LCRECFAANEVQLKLLKDQHKVAADDVLNQGSAATAAAPKPRSVRATDKKSVKKSANKPSTSTSDATATTVDVATETTEVCYLADDKADNAFAIGPQSAHLAYHNELTELRRFVQNRQIVIDKLQSQLEFVLSFVGIKDKDAIPLSTADQSDAGQASMQPLTASASSTMVRIMINLHGPRLFHGEINGLVHFSNLCRQPFMLISHSKNVKNQALLFRVLIQLSQNLIPINSLHYVTLNFTFSLGSSLLNVLAGL
jgi:hypothetical protein